MMTLKASILFIILNLIQDVSPCGVPPFAWCEDPQIAEKCGVKDKCSTYKTQTWNAKLNVSLLYETLCPDCQRFITQTLKPDLWKTAREFVNFEFIPYGNAMPSETGEKIHCQHGELECYLNKVHSCAIKYLNDRYRWFPFIYCMEDLLSQHADPEQAIKTCFDDTKVKLAERKSILNCRNGTEGERLEMEMGKKTDSVWPQKHTFVPWIVINGVSLTTAQLYQDDLVGFLCNWYNGDKKPAGCSMFEQEKKKLKCERP